MLGESLTLHELILNGYREVPTDESALGEEALKTLPKIEQAFISAPKGMHKFAFELKRVRARRRTGRFWMSRRSRLHHHASVLPRHRLQGLVMPELLPVFYPDLYA